MNTRIKEICVEKSLSIISALKLMDEKKYKLLIVLDKGLFYSLLSIGDIQRAIIASIPLEEPVSNILRPEVRVAKDTDDLEQIKEYMRERRNDFMPLVNNDKQVVDVIFWNDLFTDKIPKTQFHIPVVIMAGGKGSRLKPLTNIIPKPLIPYNEKSILEEIMDRFVRHGCHDFYLSVNYKADMIRYYFDTLNNSDYRIEYFQETEPLGTAGSLSLLKNKIQSTFFVSNCDIILDEDYYQILKYHWECKNEITMIAAVKQYHIPYGTLETKKNGELFVLQEKPELTFKINTGVYIIESHVLNEIPNNTFLHITTLIQQIMDRGGRVGVFPVSNNSWIDMGNLKELTFIG